MTNSTLNDYGLFLNLSKLDNETNEQYLERLLIAKTNHDNTAYNHDLIQFANLDNNKVLNIMTLFFDSNKEIKIRFMNKSLFFTHNAQTEEIVSDDDRIYLIGDFVSYLESKGVGVFYDKKYKGYKTEFLFNFTNEEIRSENFRGTFSFPNDMFVKGFYLSEDMFRVDSLDDLDSSDNQYFFNEEEKKIYMSKDSRGLKNISYYGNSLNCSLHWSLNKVYESKDNTFQKLTLDENKTLTSEGVALYNLINNNYSQMWG